MLLSVLIPTIPERTGMFKRLVAFLQFQLKWLGQESRCEILQSAGEESIGAKRNELIQRAHGEYCVFIDDDDWVSSRYMWHVLDALSQKDKPDCVGVFGPVFFGEVYYGMMYNSLQYHDWNFDGKGKWFRPPTRWNPMKTALARQVQYRDISSSEDYHWTLEMRDRKLIKTEAQATEPLYYYYGRPPFRPL